jgi:ornithine carbamoyltransferase
MHCLPIRRNVVAIDGVIDGPRSWTTETGGLRRWTAMALLEHML